METGTDDRFAPARMRRTVLEMAYASGLVKLTPFIKNSFLILFSGSSRGAVIRAREVSSMSIVLSFGET